MALRPFITLHSGCALADPLNQPGPKPADLEAHTLAHARRARGIDHQRSGDERAEVRLSRRPAPGTVSESFRRRKGDVILQVKDDGVGFAPRREPQGSATGELGSKLIHAMAQQLNGRLMIEPDEGAPGTVVRVRFPAR
ncbi:ATP-binding protein [Methylobacterium oxalidis]|uniref:ATP-binding protein n=1 Tax=Methylobacterium oxalidis TaxID=944322 RepID=UPI0033158391